MTSAILAGLQETASENPGATEVRIHISTLVHSPSLVKAIL